MRTDRRQPTEAPRLGLTLIEVAMASALTALLVSALAAMTLAGRGAEDRLAQIQASQTQSAVAFERIRNAIARTGRLTTPNGTPLAIRHLDSHGYYVSWSDCLICWTGGRDADRSQQVAATASVPISELLVFGDLPAGSGRLCEVAFPTAAGSIDLSTATVSAVRTLLSGSDAEIAPLCDGLRAYSDPSDTYYGGDVPKSGVFFNVRQTPLQSEINAASTPEQWSDLDWYLGQSDGDGGLRHCGVRIELQFPASVGRIDQTHAATATWPVFSAVGRVYRYEK